MSTIIVNLLSTLELILVSFCQVTNHLHYPKQKHLLSLTWVILPLAGSDAARWSRVSGPIHMSSSCQAGGSEGTSAGTVCLCSTWSFIISSFSRHPGFLHMIISWTKEHYFFSPGQTMFANILLAQASYMGIWVFFPGGTAVKNLPASAGDAGSIPGSGSFPAEGNGNPLQYSWLGNAMDSRSQFTGLQMSHARLSGLNITQNRAGQCHPTLFLCSYPSQKVVMWTYHRVITRVTEYVIS